MKQTVFPTLLELIKASLSRNGQFLVGYEMTHFVIKNKNLLELATLEERKSILDVYLQSVEVPKCKVPYFSVECHRMKRSLVQMITFYCYEYFKFRQNVAVDHESFKQRVDFPQCAYFMEAN